MWLLSNLFRFLKRARDDLKRCNNCRMDYIIGQTTIGEFMVVCFFAYFYLRAFSLKVFMSKIMGIGLIDE